MRPVAWSALLMMAFMVSPGVEACSCRLLKGTPVRQVEQSFDESGSVFVARLMRSVLKPDMQHSSTVYEEAQFEVLEVFKGELRVGQRVFVRQALNAGSCGMSSTNDPPWLQQVVKKTGETRPVKISREWLIYSGASEPYSLDQCSRSMPINVEGGKDAKMLRELIRKRRKPRR